VIIFEFASNPLCVVIMFVNSFDKSTFDDSNAPDVIDNPSVYISLPTPSKSPEFTVVLN